MAPIRRYLRITKRSVLECRIYLDNPALAKTWLLNPRDPVLPRVIEAVRPLVLPKLREENERSKGKAGKGKNKKGVKDIVVQDEFEVSIFLTELSSRHSLLTKQKQFVDKEERLKSNSTKLLADSKNEPIDVDDEGPILRREESGEYESGLTLSAIPSFEETEIGTDSSTRISKRPHSNDGEFVADSSDSDVPNAQRWSARSTKPKKQKTTSTLLQGEQGFADDKKKLAINTSYEGFNIYGRILCLVVKRKEPSKALTTNGRAVIGGQAMMENWIMSTQVAADQED